MMRQIQSGEGWRLGYDPHADTFCGLVGSEHWAIELTAAEFTDFCRLSQALAQTMSAMAEQLMAEEQLTCEQETDTIWMEVEGFPKAYSLRFILLTGRRGEGEWPAETVAPFLRAIAQLSPAITH